MTRNPTGSAVGLCLGACSTVLAAMLAAMLAAGCAPEEQRPAGAVGTPMALASAPQAVRLQATIFEVLLPPARMGELDARALAAKGPTIADFEKALAGIGKAKALYQVDQPINPAKDTVQVGASVPFVTATRMAEGGRAINTIQYQQVGAIFKFSGDQIKVVGRNGLDIQLSVEIAGLSDTGVSVGEKVNAPAMRRYSLTYTGTVELGRPFVFFSVDATTKDAEGNAVASICRAVLSEVRP